MKNWYNLHPEWTKRVLKISNKSKIRVDATTLHKVNISKIVKRTGYEIETYCYSKGECILKTEPLLIFVSGCHELAAKLIEYNIEPSFDPEDILLFIELYFIKKKHRESYEFIEKWQHSNREKKYFPAIFMKTVFNDSEKAIEYLNKMTYRNNKENYNVRLAKIFGILINDLEKAEYILKKIEIDLNVKYYKKIHETGSFRNLDWLYIAKAWIDIFGNYDKAHECIQKAAEDISGFGWQKLSKIWKTYFNLDKETEQCLEKTEDDIEELDEYFSISEYWKFLLGNEERSAHILNQGEKYLIENDKINAQWYTMYAENWYNIHLNMENTERCLSSAEKLAYYTFDWTECARLWFKFFKNRNKAEKCLKNAKKAIKTSEDMWEYDDAEEEIFLSEEYDN